MQIRQKGLLLIGGASRNVGKTSFVQNLISRYSSKYAIVGLKIKTIYEGDDFFHGNDNNPLHTDFRLTEETDINSESDAAKMLKAGATRAFHLKVKSHALLEAYTYFKCQITDIAYIVCESNSLRNVISPDLFILIKHKTQQTMKLSALKLEKYASKIVYTDGKKHNFVPDNMDIEHGIWVIK